MFFFVVSLFFRFVRPLFLFSFHYIYSFILVIFCYHIKVSYFLPCDKKKGKVKFTVITCYYISSHYIKKRRKFHSLFAFNLSFQMNKSERGEKRKKNDSFFDSLPKTPRKTRSHYIERKTVKTVIMILLSL